MTDKKLSDKNIIKALECCGRESCFGCPYRGKCHLGNPMITDSIDLITRQQTEIERLNKEIQITKDAYTMLQTKIEIIKSEAVKEFAERLKEKSEIVHLFFVHTGEHYMVDIDDIDNLVKEMVGENK